MKEAFINILTNSVQAVSSNGTIVTKTFTKNDLFVIEIRDSGVGINESDLPFIFDPFFTTKQMGTGLGLTIAHRIIEEHAGRVEVESKPGIGSTFRIFLPLNKNNEKHVIEKEV
jgi:two-component system NtrC family sensor kinase